MGIVYVQRDGLGRIDGVYANPQAGYAEEGIDQESAEVQAFLHPPDTSIRGRCAEAYRARRFARALERDPVGALVDRAKTESR
jgi:hypothetical protein